MRDSRVLIVFLLVALVRATSALNVTVGTVTCSNITVSWTTMDNRTADFTIHYNSTVHSEAKNLTMDASSHDHHTTKLTNLVADTDYTITVTAQFDNDSTTVVDTVTVKTELGTPSDKAVPYRTSTGCTSLSFMVKDPGNSPTYDCWINSTDHRLHCWTKGSNTTVSGLDPGTYYNLTCQKRPKMKLECYTGHRVVATKPNPPAKVTITQTTCNSVTVNWTPPTDNGNAEITGYKVLVYKDSNDILVQTNTTMMSYEVTSLEPKTDYTVEVRAGNVGGFGNGTSTNFTTKERVNISGRMPITVLAQSTSVNVTINGSGEVYSCTLNEQTMDITSGQTVQETGLAPNTTYTVTCYSMSDSCRESRATFTTVETPGTVRGLMSGSVSVNEDGQLQQNISWQPPVSGDVLMYLIRYGMGDSNMENATKSNTTPNTSILLTLSVPDGPLDMVVYNIWVAVVTESKEHGKATELTIQYRTPGPPRDLQVEAVSCNSIRVSWLPPNSSHSGGLPLISYRVSYNGTELYNISRGEDKLEVDIPGLQPNTLYAISVSANNTLGWGKEAQRNTTTMSRLREQLFIVTVVKSKSLTVTVMMRRTFKELQCEMSPIPNGMRTFTLMQGNKKLAGLTPNTQYTIHCVAKDGDGKDACIEQTMNVTTRKNPPGQVTNVRRAGDSWVEGGRIYQPITWDEPRATEDNEVPETYVVRYITTSPDTGTDNMTTNTKETSLVLSLPLPQQAVTYIVSVAGEADTGRGNFSDELTLQYSRPGAPTGVTVQAQSCHTLKVTWSSPNHTGGLPITGYNISYTDTQTNNTLHKYSNTTVISLQQLKPGTEYTVRVRAMNAIGQGDLTQRSGRTSQRREGYVNATANSAHSMLLSHNLTESRVRYVCNVTEVKGEEKKPVNKRVTKEIMNVTGLLPDTTYRVDCVAYHSGGVEACLEANTTVTTRPDRAQNVTVRGSTVQSVHGNDSNGSITILQNITWDAPPNHHNIQRYLIKYQMQGQPTSSETRTSSNATQASLVLLVPQGQTSTYSVWVAAVSEAGQGEFSDRVDFNYSTPAPPTGVKSVNSTCNSIRLTWSAPHYTGGVPLEGYAVRWRGRGSPLTTDKPDVTAVTVTRLSPNTSYIIDVRAVNAIGEGEQSQPITATTTSQDKSLEVLVSTNSSTSLHITAQPPPRLEMVEVNCTLTAKDNSSYIRTVSLGNTRDGGAQRLTDNLVPYTNYTATCLVFKDGVDQCYIGSATTQTYTDIPSGPPQEVSIVSTSSHSFTMTWAPPPKGQQNGEIVNYEVEYREEGSNSTVVNITTQGMRYTAEDLTPGRVYQFRVAANTVNGTGPFSEWENVTTIPTVTNLKAVNTTTNSTTITWDQPPYNYRVFLHGEATDNIPQVIELVNVTGQTTHVVEGLKSFQNYRIGVFLTADNGNGSVATVIVRTTGREPTAPPQEVLIVSTSSHSFTMMWAPPPKGEQNGEIVSYEVEYREEGSNSTVVNTTRGMRYTAEDLTTDRVYQFRVAANTVNGTGPFSKLINVTTIPTVTNLRVLNTTTSSATITWDQPPHNYTVFLHGEATDNIPQSRVIQLVNVTGQTTHIVKGLDSFRKYSISVFLASDNGNGSVATVIVRTTGREPTAPPQNVLVDSTSSHSFTMTWAPPPKGRQNGEIVSYEVEYREEGSNSTVVSTTQGMTYTAEDLTPGRVYQFRVAANTVNGTGPFSEWENVTTIPTVTNLTVINTTTNSITITWDQLPYEYTVFLHGEALDNIPQSRVIQLVDVTGQTTHIVEGLNSFRNYSISVFLAADNGNGSDETVTFQTRGQAPDGSPAHLRATPTSRSVTLQWSPPPVLSRNGILTHYVVGLANETWNTTQSHSITSEQRKRREADSEGVGEETQSLTVWHLRPFTSYTWEVAAVSGFGAGPPSDRRFETDQDAPTQVEDITVNPGNKIITWAAPAEPNGIIVSYRVQYWELGRRDTTEEVKTIADKLMFSYNNFSAGVPHKVQVQAATVAGLGKSRVIKEVLFSEEQAPAVPVSNVTITRINDTAVRVTWMRLTLNDARGFPSYVVSVTSKGKEAVNHSTNSTSVVVEGLLPHTEYNITVRALTAGGTKGGPPSTPVTIKAKPTEEPTVYSSPLIWILAVLIAVLMVVAITFIVIVAVICIRWRYIAKLKGSDYWETIPMTDRRMMDEATPALTAKTPEDKIQRKEAILRRNFCVYVQKMHQDKNGPFLTEYQNITHTPDYVSATVYQSNMIKNRYINVFPYDHCRVVLSERDSTGSDYINATYIDAYNRPNGYIATQGPTSYTLDDFWQMVWEHHAPVIVMLTKLAENSKIKCERYWETALNEPFKPGRDLSVTTLRCDTHPEFELRTIKVEKLTSKEDPLEVKHFLYTAWPDHGVPQYSISIHRFIRQHVRPVYNDSSAPLIVHCSAGAGRTGTYMAIDTMMYQLEDRQNANIFEYVERMRTRRTQMVQNASQYIYIHDAINDYINCKDTTIVAHELRPRIEEMRQIDSTTGSSGFVTQFSLLEKMSIELCDAEYAFAEQESITSRNRYITRFPYSDNYITDEEGNYINASDILGYNGQKNFIAAQAPMKHTETDVWGMICNENCTTVVVLCNFVEENEEMCSTFWPLKRSEPKEFNNITVCLEETDEQESYNTYRLTVSLTDDPDPLKVVVFHYLQWPRDGRPSIPPYLQLMGEVERSQHNVTGPTLVMCDDGMSRTGVFITTMAEVERVKVQGEVDIFQTVKAARSERPHMVSTPVDYEVCHDVLLSYLESFDTYANFK